MRKMMWEGEFEHEGECEREREGVVKQAYGEMSCAHADSLFSRDVPRYVMGEIYHFRLEVAFG
jgi:hypothetical protein